MKGSNRLLLNEATLIAALQEYIDRRRLSTAEKQTVKSVTWNGATYSVEINEEPKS